MFNINIPTRNYQHHGPVSMTRREAIFIQGKILDTIPLDDVDVTIVSDPKRPVHLVVKVPTLGRFRIYSCGAISTIDYETGVRAEAPHYRVSIGEDDGNYAAAVGQPNPVGKILDMLHATGGLPRGFTNFAYSKLELSSEEA